MVDAAGKAHARAHSHRCVHVGGQVLEKNELASEHDGLAHREADGEVGHRRAALEQSAC